MPDLINSEKKILAQIKRTLTFSYGTQYMFWFLYDDNHKAVSWEGGYDLSLTQKFRNQYTIEISKQIVQNWL
jgi:hypothetical protein